MIDPQKLLSGIPKHLRDPLIDEYRGICTAFNEGRWKLAALDAGRFCEVVYTIIHGAVVGPYASSPQKPNNFVGACRAMESATPVLVGDRSLRILIPRILPALYEVRNNRNIGHVGGDVAPNKMDATFVRDSASWILAELVRVSHGISTSEAQIAVDALVARTHPLVWEIDGIKRVLSPGLTAAKKSLILLYATPGWIEIRKLKEWTRYDGGFRDRVLKRIFDEQLIEISGENVIITPLGIMYVEENLLQK